MCHHCKNANDQMKPEECNPAEAAGVKLDGSQKPIEVKIQHENEDVSSLLEPPVGNIPIASLTVSESFGSSCSDLPVDLNSDGRDNQFDCQSTSGQNYLTQKSSTELYGNPEYSTSGCSDGEAGEPYMFDDPGCDIWIPPPAEDNSEAICDDDDEDEECGNGENFVKADLNDTEEDNNRIKEKKDKAMEEVMTGKFRTLVSQLLKTVGIADFEKESESWVDIVSSLAWEAALFVKPDTTKGKTMDPAGYVKIKCVPTGSRSESQLVKGLVFKKYVAHKHMPTKYTKPKLMLIQGSLGHSSGLSSFNSMIVQDKDNMQKKDNIPDDVRSLLEQLEACCPNVVLMEKKAPRDVLEAVRNMGVTLVAEMKLHRLERIARCTGSPIWSADSMPSQNLKKCDLVYFEKFVEEHAQVEEGGKKPQKTLMFLEGSPTRLGCTILLKGSHNQELKKIKCVVQCAVVMAYHFIRETSFLMDQEVMFSTIISDGGGAKIINEPSDMISKGSCNEDIEAASSAERTSLPLSNGFHEGHAVVSSVFSIHQNSSSGTNCSNSDHNNVVSSEPTLSNGNDTPIVGSLLQDGSQTDVPASIVAPSNGRDLANGLYKDDSNKSSSHSEHKAVVRNVLGALVAPADQYMQSYLSGTDPDAQSEIPVSVPTEAAKHSGAESNGHLNDEKLIDADNIQSTSSSTEPSLDSQRTGSDDSDDCNGRKDDISSVLDSESILVMMSSRNASSGTICEQNHFSHIKFYRNFDVPLGKFLRDNVLNQSVRCKACGEPPTAHFYYYAHHNKQLTIRVNKQVPDKCLPEGKLWMWSRCGKCKPEKEGNKNTTKRVSISSAARGLSFGKFLELNFSNHFSVNRISNCGHSLHRDFLYFFGLGSTVSMFRYSPVAKYTVAVPPQKLEFHSPITGEWLQVETKEVYTKAMSLFKEVSRCLERIQTKFPGLTLNNSSSIKEFIDIEKMLAVEKFEFEENIKNTCINDGHSVHKLLCLNRLRWELFLEACIWKQRLQLLLSSASMAARTATISKTVEEKPNVDPYSTKESEIDYVASTGEPSVEENAVCLGLNIDDDISCPGIKNPTLSTSEEVKDPTEGAVDLLSSDITIHTESLTETKKDVLEELWSPFSEIKERLTEDLRNKVQLPSFINSSRSSSGTPSNKSTISKIISEEGSRMQIPLGDDYIISDYEGEISSIVACAVAFLNDNTTHQAESLGKDENDAAQSDEGTVRSTDEAVGLSRARSEPHNAFRWSSSSFSSESDMIHTASSMSLMDSRYSSFDGLNLLASLASRDNLHPEVPLGMETNWGKPKYSVVCLYAADFRALRTLCSLSELDYITSLSRCKIWDAKGGKSKSFFAKTLDDRLIIKEIKRTEYESFMKFASEYFDYMTRSFKTGDQTCLAKVLGIYQVTNKQPKTGRETKHELMVMENLSFGKIISRQYDLKGALHARYTANADASGDVLLDQNFVIDMNQSPLYVGQKAKRLLQRAVWNDTTFLQKINVMDYSLLVGVDRKGKELVCGIIDYLRQYTWDKQLETWVKSSLVVPKNVLPTIISPKEYKKRFRKFMDTHFLTVPDQWCSRRSYNPCKLCGSEVDHPSSHPKLEKRDSSLNNASHAS